MTVDPPGGTGKLRSLLDHRHPTGELCDACAKLLDDLAAIRESERKAWRDVRDIVID